MLNYSIDHSSIINYFSKSDWVDEINLDASSALDDEQEDELDDFEDEEEDDD